MRSNKPDISWYELIIKFLQNKYSREVKSDQEDNTYNSKRLWNICCDRKLTQEDLNKCLDLLENDPFKTNKETDNPNKECENGKSVKSDEESFSFGKEE